MSAHPTEQRMPRPTRRGLAALVSTLAIAGSLALAPAAVAAPPAATLGLDVTATATTGGTVTVTVTADAVSDLYAYDLELTAPAALVAEVGSATGPDGGFTSTTADAASGTVTVTHTRLGTSPGLGSDPAAPTAPITLATMTLRAQTAGVAEIALSSARLVSTTGDVVTVVDAASASTTITAAPLPDPGTTTPPPSTGTTPGTGTGTTPGVSGQVAGDLAATGATPTPWLIAGAVGVVLIAAGALVVIRRRQAVSE